MKWTVGDPQLATLFGECIETVYKGTHLVMTWDKATDEYVVQESATKKEVARGRRKGDCYKQLKTR